MHDPYEPLKKIFRIAIFSFAGISGVALWALVGQPISINWTPKLSGALAPTEQFISSAGASLKEVKNSLTPRDTSPFTLALKAPADDLARMRKVFEAASWGNDSRSMVFYIDGHIASGGEILAHMAGVEMTTDLAYAFLGAQSSYAHSKSETTGTLIFKVADRGRVYASLVKNESRMLAVMLSLVHPGMSPSEVKMYVDRGSTVVFHDDGTNERVLMNVEGERLLSWKLSNDGLLISAK